MHKHTLANSYSMRATDEATVVGYGYGCRLAEVVCWSCNVIV